MPDFRLECIEIVYRIVVKRSWLEDDGTLKPEAFLIMREADALKGLSVQRACLCTAEQCKSKVRSGFGVDSLQVGRIGRLDLEVWHHEPDDEDHAGIMGLPPYYRKADLTLSEIARAEDLAGRLAAQARPQLRRRWRAE
ncbi:MAG: hypothetical protein ABSF25_16230 [Bryobacteraceae bacterium]